MRFPSHVFTFIAIFIAGVFYALGFPSKLHSGSLLLPIIGMSLLFYFLEIGKCHKTLKIKRGLLFILIFSVGYNTVGFYWIPHTLKEFGEIPFPFNQLLGSLFALIVAPHLYVFYLIEKILSRYYTKINTHDISLLVPFLSLLFVLCEQMIPQQFPAHLGHPWLVIAPHLSLSPYLGSPFYSFLNCLIVFVLISPFIYPQQKNYLLRFLIIFCIVLNFILPKLTADSRSPSDHSNNKTPFHVRFIQANIGNLLKISAQAKEYSSIQEVIDIFKNLSLEKTQNNLPIDLIIWPETSYPRLLDSQRLQVGLDFMHSVFYEITHTMKSEIFFGGYDSATIKNQQSPFFESEYNAAFHLSTTGELLNRYHKIKLIPFGEGLPLTSLIGPLNFYISKYVPNISFFAKGESPILFKTAKDIYFTSSICYEILFTDFIKSYLEQFQERPSFIINISNDSWFGDTSEPLQHLFLAKWRALEFNLPILRMTNTGITGVIFEDGSESERLTIGEKNYLDITIFTGAKTPTFYQRMGIWGTVLVSIFFMLVLKFKTLVLRTRFRQKTFS